MDDGEPNNLPAPTAPPPKKNNLSRPINIDSNTTSSSSSSFSSASPPDFLRQVQAAFKRHRPLGGMQSNSIRPRRLVGPQRETSKWSNSNVGAVVETKKMQDEISVSQRVRDYVMQTKSIVSVVTETQEDGLITCEEHLKHFDARKDQPLATGGKNNDTVSSSFVEYEYAPVVDWANDRMAIGTDYLPSHMGSLALTEMEWDLSNQVEALPAISQEMKHTNLQNVEVDAGLRSDEGILSLATKGATEVQDQLHQFRNFLHSDLSHPMTQSSVAGSSCATTTLVNSASAPILNSATYFPYPQNISSRVGIESLGDCNVNSQPLAPRDLVQHLHLSPKCTTGRLAHNPANGAQAPRSSLDTHMDVKDYDLYKKEQTNVPKEQEFPKDPAPLHEKSSKGKKYVGDLTDVQSQAPLSINPSTDVKFEPTKLEKQEKGEGGKATSAPRKRSYDPDLFFKVNGKLYQRLGKIGSGGSSEVHKVISQDCKIYALKRIKLKGRDYATAYGFCQEIEYLNKLKGKNHIIQLIDYEVFTQSTSTQRLPSSTVLHLSLEPSCRYACLITDMSGFFCMRFYSSAMHFVLEVTDKSLLKEVMNGSMSNKDSRVREDGNISMVLEYGEIDLAHMLSQEWKEMDISNSSIDQNWLRFYWQQILLAVNTIHEERIVHSDLKPANFLLVRGSLKLIDFGIAKAILSDTTNIQRDSQVGTLSYMSPEAFMCNETDANGNTIKCGRPSDIWSLGCILYQMVYGRTPFSEYKTFWAKFKVITDPNHEIIYEPVSNPWLLDLMKKCLAWDRDERWRIPQLLAHPFLVPPLPAQLSSPQDQSCNLLQLIEESNDNDEKALTLCSQLQKLLRDPRPALASQVSTSIDQQRKLLCEVSNLCFQLQEQLANSERG
ncbi:hypothetical protein RJ639_003750 [Escallonia herrerae]|uniref:Protein kinase domain-containing protein n=1 Tax=Escallonia herrerae TaxID=1293975 RepID=A0AA88W5D4_9ASTE|nr:hypothetical protein RJ639_003750 [Escallonia herrerae]